jgi:hypothetical protein
MWVPLYNRSGNIGTGSIFGFRQHPSQAAMLVLLRHYSIISGAYRKGLLEAFVSFAFTSPCFSVVRLCLVPHEMQNTKYQLLWNDEMQNAKIFIGVFSSIQNAKFFMGWVRAFCLSGFFGLFRPKFKMENGYLFAKNFAWCLVLFYKMMGQNPKKF